MQKKQNALSKALLRKIGKKSMSQTVDPIDWPVCPLGVVYQPERPQHAPGMKKADVQKSSRFQNGKKGK